MSGKLTLKVLIADDEPKIANLIRNLIHWSSLNIEFAGICLDGQSALDRICALQPDIVITDIRMPVITGLDMIRMVNEKRIPVHFIVVSGYRYFEYAHTALKYGVEDYLLKPIDEEELNAILEKICLQNQTMQQEQADREKMERRYNAGKIHVYGDFIQEVSEGNRQSMEEMNQRYGMDLTDGWFQAIVLAMDYTQLPESKAQREQDMYMMSERVLHIAEQELSPYVHEMVFAPTGANRFTMLLNYAPDMAAQVRHGRHQCMSQLVGYAASFRNIEITMAVSGTETAFSACRELLEGTERTLERRIYEGVGRRYRTDERVISNQPVYPQDWEKHLDGIQKAVDTFHAIEVQKEINQCFREAEQLEAWRLHAIVWGIIGTFAEKINQEESFFSAKEQEELQVECDLLASAAGKRAYLAEKLKEKLEAYKRKQKEQVRRPIQQAIDYIHKNYGEKITLEMLSEHSGFNITYFSELFKAEVGKNFSDYLLQIRMDAAKSMLREGRDTVYEIADKVGYKDSQYFSKQFEKYVGIKPKEYRKLYL